MYLRILRLNRTVAFFRPGDVGVDRVRVTRERFLEDRQGKTFANVVNDPEQPFDKVLDFFDERVAGMPYRSVRERCHELAPAPSPTRTDKRLGRRSTGRSASELG